MPDHNDWVQMRTADASSYLLSTDENTWCQVIPTEFRWGQLMLGYTCWVQMRTADVRSYLLSSDEQLMLVHTFWVQMRTADVRSYLLSSDEQLMLVHTCWVLDEDSWCQSYLYVLRSADSSRYNTWALRCSHLTTKACPVKIFHEKL